MGKITLGKKLVGLVARTEVTAVIYNEDGSVYQDLGVIATEEFDDEKEGKNATDESRA